MAAGDEVMTVKDINPQRREQGLRRQRLGRWNSECALVEVGWRDILEPTPLCRGWCKASIRVGMLIL